MNEQNGQKTTSISAPEYVTMPGPGGTTVVMTPEAKDEVERHANILRITPDGENPVIYWHQVAQDAIKSAESARNQAKQARDELNRSIQSYDNLIEKIARQNTEYRAQIEKEKAEVPFDLSRLVGLAGQGDIDLNVTVQIKGKRRPPLYEHEDE